MIGRSAIVGKPVAHLLLQANATVTVCHSRTVELARHTRDADVLVAAVGVAGLVSPEMVKAGATVIDVGMNRTEAGLVGDVDPGAMAVAGRMTPVPGRRRADDDRAPPAQFRARREVPQRGSCVPRRVTLWFARFARDGGSVPGPSQY